MNLRALNLHHLRQLSVPRSEEDILNTIWFFIIALEVVLVIGIAIQSMVRRLRSKAVSYSHRYPQYYYAAQSDRSISSMPLLPTLEQQKKFYLESTSRKGIMIP